MNFAERIVAVRDAMSRAAAASDEADSARAERDRLVAELHTVDGWSYGSIAKATGLSRGLVAVICRAAMTGARVSLICAEPPTSPHS